MGEIGLLQNTCVGDREFGIQTSSFVYNFPFLKIFILWTSECSALPSLPKSSLQCLQEHKHQAAHLLYFPVCYSLPSAQSSTDRLSRISRTDTLNAKNEVQLIMCLNRAFLLSVVNKTIKSVYVLLCFQHNIIFIVFMWEVTKSSECFINSELTEPGIRGPLENCIITCWCHYNIT